MSEGTVGLVVLFACAVVASFLAHLLIRSMWIAVLVAATAAAALFQIFAYLHLGYLDKFAAIACCSSWGITIPIAAVIGIPFYLLRKPPPAGYCQQCGYDLTGNVTGKCSECGAPVPTAPGQEHAPSATNPPDSPERRPARRSNEVDLELPD